jgi:Phage integrase family
MVGSGPARGRSIQRSFTVHGNAALAGKARRELVAEYGSARSDIKCAASAVTVGELLEGYLGSAQLWKPATAASHRHVVSTLLGDPLCRCRLQSLTPAVTRAAICRWREDGVSVPKVSARWLLLRAAVSWAVAEDLLRLKSLAGMHGPPRPRPGATTAWTRCAACWWPPVMPSRRRTTRSGAGPARSLARPAPVRRRAVAAAGPPGRGLRGTAGRAGGAAAAGSGRPGPDHRAEPVRRRPRLHQVREDPAGDPGSGTADIIRRHFSAWAARAVPEQDWLLSPSPRRPAHLTAGALSRRLAGLGAASGVEHAGLHRLRHGVATYLVGQGRLLKAQARLGHRDPATTLRHYSHAVPLDDADAADQLDGLLNGLEPRHPGTQR